MGLIMKVTATQYNTVSAIDTKQTAKNKDATPAVAAAKSQQPTAIDPVLGDAQAHLSALPEIDMDKVAEMKEAISKGQISINVDELTAAMQKYYQG
jgi:negative regulator of flagellin synthesis FlgM